LLGYTSSTTLSNSYYVDSILQSANTGALPRADEVMQSEDFLVQLDKTRGRFKLGNTYPLLAWEPMVAGAPLIETQPAHGTWAAEGAEPTALEVTATLPPGTKPAASGTLGYQWFEAQSANGMAGEAVTESSPTGGFAPPTDVNGPHYYYCVVTNRWGGGSAVAASNVVVFYVEGSTPAAQPRITTQPADVLDLQAGTSPIDAQTLKVAAAVSSLGAGELSYQWHKRNGPVPNAETDEAIDGATAPAFAPEVSQAGVVYYYCVVVNTFTPQKTASVVSRVARVVVSNPRIATAVELATFARTVNEGTSYVGLTIELAADIDLAPVSHPAGEWPVSGGASYDSAASWAPIGTYNATVTSARPFKGTFDGQGHTISGLYINAATTHQGLFGYASGATIQNLSVSGSITSSTGYVGGIVARAAYDSTNTRLTLIKNVGSDVDITCTGTTNSAANYVGGIVGYYAGNASMYASDAIAQSYFTGSISAAMQYVGGLAGVLTTQGGKVRDNYSTGIITCSKGYQYLGSLFGYVNGANWAITDCYSAGSFAATASQSTSYLAALFGRTTSTTSARNYCLDTILSSYPDVGATSKNSSELQILAPLLNGASSPGFWSADITGAPLNSGYPILAWQTALPGGPKAFTAATLDTSGDAPVVRTSFVYDDGNPIEPDLSIVYHVGQGDERALEKGTDYTVIYANNTQAGTALATVTFGPAFIAESIVVYFEIVDHSALSVAITSAQDSLGATAESADGKDVSSAQNWATQAARAALEAAIATAQLARNNSQVTQAGIEDAVTELQGAVTAFTSALRPGALELTNAASALAAVIVLAQTQAERADIQISQDGSDVYVDKLWIAQADIDVLKAAIASAQSVLANTSAAQAEIEGATTALSSVTTAFATSAVRAGTKTYYPQDAPSIRLDGLSSSGEQGDRHKTMRHIVDAFIGIDGIKPDTVILAKSDNFPDALSAAGLAGLHNAPVLTSSPDTLVFEAAELIRDIQPSSVFVLGDEKGSFSNDVLETVRKIVPAANITRLSGEDRYGTALDIYRQGEASLGGWSDTAIITRGDNFADALSISSFAWATRSPIFLVDPTSDLNEKSLEALASGNFSKVYILGDLKSVPQKVVTQLSDKGITGYGEVTSLSGLAESAQARIVRLAGKTRYQTSVLIAEEVVAQAQRMSVVLGHDNTLVTKGTDFPDALAGGALAGKLSSTLVLADPSAGADNHVLDGYLAPHRQEIGRVYVLGDTKSISTDLLMLIEGARAG
jgi:putative cell wall-binding protein